MTIRKGTGDDAAVQVESQLLRAICQGTPQGSVRESARHILKDYRWRDPLHGAFFEIVSSLTAASQEALRTLMPALLTRRGFPDVDWEDFFAPHGLTKEEALGLMRHLKDL